MKRDTDSKAACVLCNGCPELRHDAAAMQELLRSEGWAITSDVRRADLVVLCACGAVPHSQRHSLRLTRELAQRKRRGARLLVCGCLSSIQPELLRQVYDGPTWGPADLGQFADIVGATVRPPVFSVHHLVASISHWEKPRLARLLSEWRSVRQVARWFSRERRGSLRPVDSRTCCIRAATGCLHQCSFCAIRLARGYVRSRLIEDVVADARAGLCEGHREILLLATDLGAYGRDRGTTLPALLHELVGMPGDFSLGLRNVQPRHLFDMMPALQDVLRTGRIGVVLSGALSGSNRILGLMKRGYRIEEFRKAVEAIKRASPCTRITTQIIVGFPGETDEDFEESIRLVRDGTVDAFVPYAFEASPGTEAAGMSDPVPQHVVTRRYRRLSELAHQLSR